MENQEEYVVNRKATEAQPIGLPVLNAVDLGKNIEMKELKQNPVHAIKTQLQVNLGEVSLTVGELANLKEHQVLALNTRFDEVIDLTLDGQVVARGQLIALDGHFAIQVTELPLPLSL